MKTIAAAFIILFLAHIAPAHADDPVASADPRRLRATTPVVERAIEAGYERSSTFRKLVDAVACSDLIVYITHKTRPGTGARGMMQFVTSTPATRYVRIEVDASLPLDSLVALIGHELQHAYEVAHAPEVVDGATFRNFYRSISPDRCRAGRYECYDTAEAVSAGWRVLKELTSDHRTWFGTPWRVALLRNSVTATSMLL